MKISSDSFVIRFYPLNSRCLRGYTLHTVYYIGGDAPCSANRRGIPMQVEAAAILMYAYNHTNKIKKTQWLLYYGLLPLAICLESFMGEFTTPILNWRFEIFHATALLGIASLLMANELKFILCAIVLTFMYGLGVWQVTLDSPLRLSVTLQSSWPWMAGLPAVAGLLAACALWIQHVLTCDHFTPRSAAVLAGWTGFFLLMLARAALGVDQVEQAAVLHHAAAGGLTLATVAGLLLPGSSRMDAEGAAA